MPANSGIAPNTANISPSQGREFVNSMHQQPMAPAESQGILDVFSDLRGLQQNLDQVQAGVPSDQLSAAPATSMTPNGVPAQNFSPRIY